ncbi:MAG TPA: hypothetical protein VFT19_11860 [Solirubrobacterales bacterium]|nr:hypothetical protein [Solirubrobacterales bacterium]
MTDWEIWNEPNLVENNPVVSKASCEAEGQPFIAGAGTCIQPEKYGQLLVYTAAAIQQASQTKAAKNTGILFGGIAFPYGDSYQNFVTKAYNVPGVASAYTGMSIHPYGFDPVTKTASLDVYKNQVNNSRSILNGLPGGPSKPLWITEVGWPLDNFGDSNFPAVDEGQQADLLSESISWAKSEETAKNIQVLLWYNSRDANFSHWAYRCGLRDMAGNYRESWWAYQEQTGKPKWPAAAPPVVAVKTATNQLYIKSGDLYGEWVNVIGPIKKFSVASDPVNGPLIAVITADDQVLVKQGDLHGQWVNLGTSAQSVTVATDEANGPLIGIVTGDGTAFVKQGSPYAPWVEEFGGIKSLRLSTDPVNGPLIGVLTNEGHAWVKQGSLYGAWVHQIGPVQSLELATDSSHGPLIGIVTGNGTAAVKQGSLYAPWVEEFGGVKSLSLASDPKNGALIGVLTNDEHAWVKQGSLYATWVDEIAPVQEVDLESDRFSGALIGVRTTGENNILVKQGSILETWVTEWGGIPAFALGG